MDAVNLIKWEAKISAIEGRILVTHFFARSQQEMLLLENDKQRISCFERTGCLITTQVCPDQDIKISPQGVTISFIVSLLLPVETQDEIYNTPEPQEESQEIQNIADLMNDVDLEDAELLLDNDIEHNVL